MEVPNGKYVLAKSSTLPVHFKCDFTANEHEEEKCNLAGNIFQKAQPCDALG